MSDVALLFTSTLAFMVITRAIPPANQETTMSTKTKKATTKTSSKATEKARRDAIAATQANLERIDAGLDREVTSPAIDPSAQQVASIDVDPKVEIAAARKHAAKGKKGAKPTPKPPKAKAPKQVKPAKEPKTKTKKVSALDAAAQVLAKSDKPMTSKALIDAMAEQKLWSSPGGKTPEATLYAAMLREITAKGKESRFKKVDRGLFTSNA